MCYTFLWVAFMFGKFFFFLERKDFDVFFCDLKDLHLCSKLIFMLKVTLLFSSLESIPVKWVRNGISFSVAVGKNNRQVKWASLYTEVNGWFRLKNAENHKFLRPEKSLGQIIARKMINFARQEASSVRNAAVKGGP